MNFCTRFSMSKFATKNHREEAIATDWKRIKAENETLRARLAEIEKQEPVGEILNTIGATQLGSEFGTKYKHSQFKDFASLTVGTKLYSAPVVSPLSSTSETDVEKLIADHNSDMAACHEQFMDVSREVMSLKTELEATRKNAEWISVFDKLPSDGQQVLVWEDLTLHGTGRVFKGCVLYYWRDGIGWVANAGDDDAYPMICITHWKPLPEPPAIEQAKSCNELHEKGGA